METKSWLKSKGHFFTEYNISENVEYADRLVQMGYRVTPVVVIGGDTIVGFSPQKLAAALE